MSVDTKPNLSNCKFEQFAGDSLYLSGCTEIFGDFTIACGATLHVCPQAGLGKYMTSDENGNATWQNFAGITGATNGLSKSAQDIILGGTLISATSICSAGNDLLIGRLTDWSSWATSGVTLQDSYICLVSTQFENIISSGNYYQTEDYCYNQSQLTTTTYSTCIGNSLAMRASGNETFSSGFISTDDYGGIYLCSCCQTTGGSFTTVINMSSDAIGQQLTCNSGYDVSAIGICGECVFACIGKGYTGEQSYFNIFKDGIDMFTYANNINAGFYLCTCTGNTYIDMAVYDNSTGSATGLHLDPLGNSYINQNITGSYANIGICCGGISLYSDENTTGNQSCICLCHNDISVYGYSPSGFTGIKYLENYSQYFTNRSLVDKEYVDINSGGVITGATNGLCVNGKDIVLGGTLTGNTHIGIEGYCLEISGCCNNKMQGICMVSNGMTLGDYCNLVSYLSISENQVSAHVECPASCAYSTCNHGDIGIGASSVGMSYTNPTANDIGRITMNTQVCLNSTCGCNGCCNGIIITPEYTAIGGNSTNCLTVGKCTDFYNFCYDTTFHIVCMHYSPTDVTLCGVGPGFAGIQYVDDYSSGFTNNSLVNKGWVLSQISGGSGGGGNVTGATNGLHINNKMVALGGNLTGNTLIDTCGYDFNVCGFGSNPFFLKLCDAPHMATINSCNCTSVCGCSGVGIHAGTNLTVESTGLGYSAVFHGYNVNICGDNTLSICGCQMFIVDNDATPVGIQYAANYSANYTDRSLVDKAYVLAQISGGSALSTFTITGNSSATGFTVNHAKGKQFVAVEVVRGSSPYDTIYTSVSRPNANCVCVTFNTAPASGQQFKILITS